MKLRSVGRAAIAVAAAVGLGSPGVAAAEVIGPCEAAINGVDVTRRSASDPAEAVDVNVGDTVTVSVSAARSTGPWRLGIEYAGVVRQLNDGPGAAGQFTAAADLADYTTYGVGLYRVVGSSELCDGAALVNVTGRSPLTTVAGAAALGLAAVGLVAPVAVGRRRGRTSRPVGWGAVPGIVAGTLGGFGGLVLAQQYALVYPTALTAGVAVGAGALVGGLATSLLSGRGEKRPPGAEPAAAAGGQSTTAGPPASPPAHATPDAPTGPPAAPSPAGGPPDDGTPGPPPELSATHRVPDTGLDVYPGPDPARVPDIQLRAGATVRVLERRGDWARVRTGSGATGWIDARDLEQLGP